MDPREHMEGAMAGEGGEDRMQVQGRRGYGFPQEWKIPQMDADFRTYLGYELPRITQEHPETIIREIEKISQQDIQDPRDVLFLNLEPFLGENTRIFVSKLMHYRRKPCRDGIACRRGPTCYFRHDGDFRSQMDMGDRRGPGHPRMDEGQASLRVLFDKQKRIFELLENKPFPSDVKLLLDKLRKTCVQVRGQTSGRQRKGEGYGVSQNLRRAQGMDSMDGKE